VYNHPRPSSIRTDGQAIEEMGKRAPATAPPVEQSTSRKEVAEREASEKWGVVVAT